MIILTKTHEQFIRELYSKNDKVTIVGKYLGATKYIKAKCKRCGFEWEAKAYSLLSGRACPKCRTIRGIENNKGLTAKKSHKAFVNELKIIDKDILVKSNYENNKSIIKCKCNRCNNQWEAKAYSLLQGHGCPRCAKSGTSFMEQFIRLSFIKKLSDSDVISRDRKTIGMELDIVIPKLKIAIEPGNWYLHKKSLLRDSKKRTLCAEKGIKLITVYDKFPVNENKPFLDNCIVFTNDYNKADHKEIRNLVEQLFKISKIKCDFTLKEWNDIEKNAYELSKSKTHDEFIEEMKKIHPNIIVLDQYENSNKRIKVKCNVCGFEWYGVPANMVSGDGCRKCGTIKAHKNFIKDDKTIINDLKKKNPNIEVIGKYTGRHNPIRVKCKRCGFEWEPIFSSLLRGSSHKNAKSMHKDINN